MIDVLLLLLVLTDHLVVAQPSTTCTAAAAASCASYCTTTMAGAPACECEGNVIVVRACACDNWWSACGADCPTKQVHGCSCDANTGVVTSNCSDISRTSTNEEEDEGPSIVMLVIAILIVVSCILLAGWILVYRSLRGTRGSASGTLTSLSHRGTHAAGGASENRRSRSMSRRRSRVLAATPSSPSDLGHHHHQHTPYGNVLSGHAPGSSAQVPVYATADTARRGRDGKKEREKDRPPVVSAASAEAELDSILATLEGGADGAAARGGDRNAKDNGRTAASSFNEDATRSALLQQYRAEALAAKVGKGEAGDVDGYGTLPEGKGAAGSTPLRATPSIGTPDYGMVALSPPSHVNDKGGGRGGATAQGVGRGGGVQGGGRGVGVYDQAFLGGPNTYAPAPSPRGNYGVAGLVSPNMYEDPTELL